MSKQKKYYWLKLEKDFFDKVEIKKLRRMAGGDTYTIIYLKMLLLSLKEEGDLFYDGIGDDFIDELALDIDEEVEDVKMVCIYLENKKLMEIVSDDEYHLSELPEMVGKETGSAKKMRRHRDKEAKKTIEGSQSDQDVIESDTELELELEKELELDKETYRDSDSISEVQEILNHYLSKDIIQHNKLTSSMRTAINARLKDYSYEQLIQSIDNYSTVYHSDEYWFDTKYGLTDLMRDKDVRKFIDEAEPLKNYIKTGKDEPRKVAEYDPKVDAF